MCGGGEEIGGWEPKMRMRAKEMAVGDPTHFNGKIGKIGKMTTATAGFGSAQRKVTNACCRN